MPIQIWNQNWKIEQKKGEEGAEDVENVYRSRS
jgi:hypothetical protein